MVCDIAVLDFLFERECWCGLGEMVKYYFFIGDDLLVLLLDERVVWCVVIKVEVVGGDERESIVSDNIRGWVVLNYGYTLVYVLEVEGEHDLCYGEVVVIGLVYVVCLGYVFGCIDADRVAEHVWVVVEEYGLVTVLFVGVDRDCLVELMGRDKKAVDGLIFVLDGVDGVEVVVGVACYVVDAAFEV